MTLQVKSKGISAGISPAPWSVGDPSGPTWSSGLRDSHSRSSAGSQGRNRAWNWSFGIADASLKVGLKDGSEVLAQNAMSETHLDPGPGLGSSCGFPVGSVCRV